MTVEGERMETHLAMENVKLINKCASLLFSIDEYNNVKLATDVERMWHNGSRVEKASAKFLHQNKVIIIF